MNTPRVVFQRADDQFDRQGVNQLLRLENDRLLLSYDRMLVLFSASGSKLAECESKMTRPSRLRVLGELVAVFGQEGVEILELGAESVCSRQYVDMPGEHQWAAPSFASFAC